MAEQFAWLIEVSGPHYLAVSKISPARFVWTRDHDEAIRFMSRKQADDVMTAIRELRRELFVFPTGEEPRPVEHAWLDGPEHNGIPEGANPKEIDSLGYPLAEQPHPIAYFNPMYRSRHNPSPTDGWRFAIRCVAECHDGVGSISATRDPASVSAESCPECGGPVEIFNPNSEASR